MHRDVADIDSINRSYEVGIQTPGGIVVAEDIWMQGVCMIHISLGNTFI